MHYAGVSTSALLTPISGGSFFVPRACPLCCRMLSGVPGFWLLGASSSTPSYDNQNYLQSLSCVPRGTSVGDTRAWTR